MVCGLPGVPGQLRLDELPLLFVEPLDILRKVGDDEEPDNCDDAGRDALDDEDPSPAAVATRPVHLPDGTGKQATEGARQGGGAEEEAEALLRLAPRVPHAHEIEAWCLISMGHNQTKEPAIGTYIQETCRFQTRPERSGWPSVRSSSGPGPDTTWRARKGTCIEILRYCQREASLTIELNGENMRQT